jgi:hypothetical protein
MEKFQKVIKFSYDTPSSEPLIEGTIIASQIIVQYLKHSVEMDSKIITTIFVSPIAVTAQSKALV